MDQELGRAFNAEIVKREIEAITDLESAKLERALGQQQSTMGAMTTFASDAPQA